MPLLPQTITTSRRYSSDVGAEGRLEQQSDGLYARYLPSQLLQEMNIVDTPGEVIVPCVLCAIHIPLPHLSMPLDSGTNVILERQQRLTEEYVPRADLVLFVMSADRPFSDSEVRGGGRVPPLRSGSGRNIVFSRARVWITHGYSLAHASGQIPRVYSTMAEEGCFRGEQG